MKINHNHNLTALNSSPIYAWKFKTRYINEDYHPGLRINRFGDDADFSEKMRAQIKGLQHVQRTR